MSIDIWIWWLGTAFSLGIFSLKLGLGLKLSNLKFKTILSILFLYTLLFILLSIATRKIQEILLTILTQGYTLHTIISLGLITWGIYLLFYEKHEASSIKNSFLMIIPCPVCLSAMLLSIFTAQNSLKLNPLFIGLILGIIFNIMSLLVIFLSNFIGLRNINTNLGLVMLLSGLYYILSIIVPAKIIESIPVYQSLSQNSINIDKTHAIIVIFMLLIIFLMGILKKRNRITT